MSTKQPGVAPGNQPAGMDTAFSDAFVEVASLLSSLRAASGGRFDELELGVALAREVPPCLGIAATPPGGMPTRAEGFVTVLSWLAVKGFASIPPELGSKAH